MDPIQQAAYIIAQAACAQVEAIGMQAENADCAARGCTPLYCKDDFERLIDKYGISHNAVIGMFRG